MDVVAAVIERKGRILICQRRRGARHALKWEFPGGKVEPGEDGPSALSRELREELNIDARIGPMLHTEAIHYPGGLTLHLQFFHVTDFFGEPKNLEFEQIVWEHRRNLTAYDFLEGDIAFVKKLAARPNLAPGSK